MESAGRETEGPHRKVLYGRRKGPRLSPRRQALVRDLLPTVSIDPDTAHQAFNEWLSSVPTNGELWLEIGFGKGEHLAMQARQHPDFRFIGCEPFLNGVAGLLAEIDKGGLGNVRIYPDDARDILRALPADSLDKVVLLHPDPWPKTRHEKRRFLISENLDLLSRAMKTDAELRVQTDHPDYAAWALVQLNDRSDFIWSAESAGDWRQRPADWPQTRYEAKARRQGRPSVYLSFRKARSSGK